MERLRSPNSVSLVSCLSAHGAALCEDSGTFAYRPQPEGAYESERLSLALPCDPSRVLARPSPPWLSSHHFSSRANWIFSIHVQPARLAPAGVRRGARHFARSLRLSRRVAPCEPTFPGRGEGFSHTVESQAVVGQRRTLGALERDRASGRCLISAPFE